MTRFRLIVLLGLFSVLVVVGIASLMEDYFGPERLEIVMGGQLPSDVCGAYRALHTYEDNYDADPRMWEWGRRADNFYRSLAEFLDQGQDREFPTCRGLNYYSELVILYSKRDRHEVDRNAIIQRLPGFADTVGIRGLFWRKRAVPDFDLTKQDFEALEFDIYNLLTLEFSWEQLVKIGYSGKDLVIPCSEIPYQETG